ncbi:choline dehydrogenase [Chloroflexi bacterium TSY]|nr:choline dehydrogenase [Chloroflexi bacterium TSY]
MSYDYIIIGASSAGCVLANRLSADGQYQVLLLEAGGPDKKQEVQIPAAFSKLYKTEVDWNYETMPQTNAGGRQLYWPRGKMLGGSSSMNAMIYQRGNPNDYNNWAALGNEEWSWDDVLPYFKKAQHQERGDSTMHGRGGPLNVADLRDPNPLSLIFVQAAMQAGYAGNDDFNDGAQEGFGLYQVTQKRGSRHSAATAYLKPALKRSNLRVETGAQATQLLFDEQRCVGVKYMQNGHEHTEQANRDVILSGGAINSPQLLMLSGVGPDDHLQAMGIQTVVDLPGVGQNLQDHLAVAPTWYCTQKITLASAESLGNWAKLLLFKKGMFTSNVGEAGGFIRLDAASLAPELQYHFAPVFSLRHGFDSPQAHGFTVAPTLVKVHSRGDIKLKSADPLTHPEIQPNYLADERDVDVLLEGVKIARHIVQQSAFDPYRGDEYTPGASVITDDEIRDFVRQHCETLYHPVGTCKMGVDPLAVVNPELQVHGVAGLRVADASIMPEIINANTNAPTIMIGERCAHLILNGS